jgi:hypothetical protein
LHLRCLFVVLLVVFWRIVIRSDINRLRGALDHIIHDIPAEASEVDQRGRGGDVERGYDLAIVGDKTGHDQSLLVCGSMSRRQMFAKDEEVVCSIQF